MVWWSLRRGGRAVLRIESGSLGWSGGWVEGGFHLVFTLSPGLIFAIRIWWSGGWFRLESGDLEGGLENGLGIESGGLELVWRCFKEVRALSQQLPLR